MGYPLERAMKLEHSSFHKWFETECPPFLRRVFLRVCYLRCEELQNWIWTNKKQKHISGQTQTTYSLVQYGLKNTNIDRTAVKDKKPLAGYQECMIVLERQK